MLTADAVGAVNALRSSTSVDPQQIGFVGTSRRAGSSPVPPWNPSISRSSPRPAPPSSPTTRSRPMPNSPAGATAASLFRPRNRSPGASRTPDPLGRPETVSGAAENPGALAVWHRRPRGLGRPERRAPDRPEGPRQGLHRRHLPWRGPRPARLPSQRPRAPTTFVEWIRNRVHPQGS